jgi:hypothetical protein
VAEGGVLGALVVDAHPAMRNAAKQARPGLMGNFIRRRINFVFMVLGSVLLISWGLVWLVDVVLDSYFGVPAALCL